MNSGSVTKYVFGLVAAVLFIPSPAISGAVRHIDSPEKLAQALDKMNGVVVFGRVRWIQDGEELRLGKSMFGNVIEFQMYRAGSKKRMIAKVGPNGYFTWVLRPGHYRVPVINFMSKSKPFLGQAFLHLVVPDHQEVTYTGTLKIKTGGKAGRNRRIEEYSVSDDCAADCPIVTGKLSLSDELVGVSLLQLDQRVLAPHH